MIRVLRVALLALGLLQSSVATAVDEGARLYSELGCAACHGESPSIIPRQGPSLHQIASRVSPDWLRHFLTDPEAGHMPHLSLQPDDLPVLQDWLGSLGPKLKAKIPRHASADEGLRLIEEIGCAVCHDDALPYPDLVAKTDFPALVHTLRNMKTIRPDGRMPHIQLSAQEAADISAYLLNVPGSDPRPLPRIPAWPDAATERITKGRQLAQNAGCASCHSGTDLPEPARVGRVRAVDCTATTHRYALDAEDRAQLAAYLQSARTSSPGLSFSTLGCTACHSRGDQGPDANRQSRFIGDASLGDSGKRPPPLDGIGAKLTEQALLEIFRGEARHRPYLKTRMPMYETHAARLTDWLTALDKTTNQLALAQVADADRATFLAAGRKLLGMQGGLNCITCHRWGDRTSLGIQGLDLRSLPQRLQPDWFRSYMLDPAAYRPGTLMPGLWPNAHSQLPDILDGNTEMQLAAIWAFIKAGKGEPEGYPEQAEALFELRPVSRPIVQRSFMKGVGTKAILVGFTNQIHMAYDGETAQPALMWHGRFFDARVTWFVRHMPFQEPLGEDVKAFPAVDAARFVGYVLDTDGNPTFLSRKGTQHYEDAYRAVGNTLQRTLRWTTGPPPPLSHPEQLLQTIDSRTPGTLNITYRWP